jgi:hypothetical protein
MTDAEIDTRLERYQRRVAELKAETSQLLQLLERLVSPVAPEPGTDLADEPPRRTAGRATESIGEPLALGSTSVATDTTYLYATGGGDALHVVGESGGMTGVGQADAGVRGYSYGGDAVVGFAVPPNGASGVHGRSTHIGVHGESEGGGAGVYGHSRQGPGTVGVSRDCAGVVAFSRHREAVNASSVESDGLRATTTSADAVGVLAENGSGSPDGVALAALGQAGVGVYAAGNHAPLQFAPADTAGAPRAGWHTAGELFLDVNADLFLCKASGEPGSWWAFVGRLADG